MAGGYDWLSMVVGSAWARWQFCFWKRWGAQIIYNVTTNNLIYLYTKNNRPYDRRHEALLL